MTRRIYQMMVVIWNGMMSGLDSLGLAGILGIASMILLIYMLFTAK